MDPKPSPIPVRRASYAIILLAFAAAFALVWKFLAEKPIVQIYGLAAIGTVFLLIVAWVSVRAAAQAATRHWSHFSLSTLVIWLVPYAAISAWIIKWTGPYDEYFS